MPISTHIDNTNINRGAVRVHQHSPPSGPFRKALGNLGVKLRSALWADREGALRIWSRLLQAERGLPFESGTMGDCPSPAFRRPSITFGSLSARWSSTKDIQRHNSNNALLHFGAWFLIFFLFQLPR